MIAETISQRAVVKLPLEDEFNYPIPQEEIDETSGNDKTRKVEVRKPENKVQFSLDLTTEAGRMYFAKIILADTLKAKRIGSTSYDKFIKAESVEQIAALQEYLSENHAGTEFTQEIIIKLNMELFEEIDDFIDQKEVPVVTNEIPFPMQRSA